MPTPKNAPYKKLQQLQPHPVIYHTSAGTSLFRMRDRRQYYFRPNMDNLTGERKRATLIRVSERKEK
jgi:hypothetical protein